MNIRFIFVVIFGLSLLINIFSLYLLVKNNQEIQSVRSFSALQQKYPLLSRRIMQEFPQDILVSFLGLRKDLRSTLAPYGPSFGLYFEYLPTGTSININGTNEFYAASLFKVPVIMAYFHNRERLARTDDPEITLTRDMLDGRFGDLWKKGAGFKLKASEAVRLAIVESDNTAARSLVPLIERQDFEAVYQGLDIDLQSDNEGAVLTAKNYTSILKALYFSAVLNKDSSEYILDILTKTKFPDKMVAGIPNNIVVAHKIGDYSDDKGTEAFMDCGIVYVPRRPYALCMLSITDEQTARERMQLVSKKIYDYVSQVK